MANNDDQTKHALIFTYGTLKQGYPNHNLMQHLISQREATYVGAFTTQAPYPLVVGPHGIPYLINLPDQAGAHRVKGDLYSVSAGGLVRVDDLEGTGIGHYERLPVRVVDGSGAISVDAEAYFAHRRFGERMWAKRGRVGLSEYGEREAEGYVRKEDRINKANHVVDDIEQFLSS